MKITFITEFVYQALHKNGKTRAEIFRMHLTGFGMLTFFASRREIVSLNEYLT